MKHLGHLGAALSGIQLRGRSASCIERSSNFSCSQIVCGLSSCASRCQCFRMLREVGLGFRFQVRPEALEA